MKTEFQAKLLQHMVQKKQDQGFTLIELLVVIIIIGILAAIALPSFLNQANKAKQAEAKTNVGSMNRAQQAYYLEKNAFVGQAASDFGNLGLGIATQTVNYKYSITPPTAGANPGVSNLARAVQPNAPLKEYVGGVNVGTVTATSEATTLAVLCEAKRPLSAGGAVASAATYAQSGPSCPANFDPL